MAAITTTGRSDDATLARAFKEALYAGVLSFGLFVLFIGLKTDQNIRNELILVPRWRLLGVIVVLVMIARFVAVAWLQPWIERRKAEKARAPVVEAPPGFIRQNFNALGIGFLLIQYMNLLLWRDAAVAIWAIVVVVMTLDWLSGWVRRKVM